MIKRVTPNKKLASENCSFDCCSFLHKQQIQKEIDAPKMFLKQKPHITPRNNYFQISKQCKFIYQNSQKVQNWPYIVTEANSQKKFFLSQLATQAQTTNGSKMQNKFDTILKSDEYIININSLKPISKKKIDKMYQPVNEIQQDKKNMKITFNSHSCQKQTLNIHHQSRKYRCQNKQLKNCLFLEMQDLKLEYMNLIDECNSLRLERRQHLQEYNIILSKLQRQHYQFQLNESMREGQIKQVKLFIQQFTKPEQNITFSS